MTVFKFTPREGGAFRLLSAEYLVSNRPGSGVEFVGGVPLNFRDFLNVAAPGAAYQMRNGLLECLDLKGTEPAVADPTET